MAFRQKLCIIYTILGVWAILSSREIIKKLRQAGWVLDTVNGSHHHFRHPARAGKVTVTHPAKDTPIGTIRSIEKQSGVKLR